MATPALSPWLVGGLAALGVAAAVWAWWRQPPDQRWRVDHPWNHRRLKEREEKIRRGDWVEIAGQPARAWRAIGLTTLPLWPGVAMMVADRRGWIDLLCVRWGGRLAAEWFMDWVMFVLPALLMFVSLWLARLSWRGLRQGCFPPPDAVLPMRAYGDRTWVGRLRAGAGLVLPVLALGVIGLSASLHRSLGDRFTEYRAPAALPKACAAPRR